MIIELNDWEAFGGGGDEVVAEHLFFRNYMVREWDQLDSQRILQNTSIYTHLEVFQESYNTYFLLFMNSSEEGEKKCVLTDS